MKLARITISCPNCEESVEASFYPENPHYSPVDPPECLEPVSVSCGCPTWGDRNDVSGLTEDAFWLTVAERIEDALRD